MNRGKRRASTGQPQCRLQTSKEHIAASAVTTRRCRGVYTQGGGRDEARRQAQVTFCQLLSVHLLRDSAKCGLDGAKSRVQLRTYTHTQREKETQTHMPTVIRLDRR
jgi:hypothetical protein